MPIRRTTVRGANARSMMGEQHPGQLKLSTTVQFALFIIVLSVLAALGSLWQNAVVGEVAIGIYAVCALVFRIASATAFKMVLVTFATIAVTAALSPDSDIVDTLAVYAYLLLVVGVCCAIFEQFRGARRSKEPAGPEHIDRQPIRYIDVAKSRFYERIGSRR